MQNNPHFVSALTIFLKSNCRHLFHFSLFPTKIQISHLSSKSLIFSLLLFLSSFLSFPYSLFTASTMTINSLSSRGKENKRPIKRSREEPILFLFLLVLLCFSQFNEIRTVVRALMTVAISNTYMQKIGTSQITKTCSILFFF